ncbi:MAG: hypothetical protein ACHQ1H_05410 [Nitrososphaerales archaeon]
MNEPLKPTDEQQDIVARMLLAAAVRVSTMLDGVSNWLTINLGIILSFIFGNIDKLINYVDVEKIKNAVFLYVFILLLALLQKRMSLLISSANEGDRIVREAISISGPGVVDARFYISEYLDATYRPRRYFMEKQLEKIRAKREAGDHVWYSKELARAAQRQEIYVFLQAVITIVIASLFATAIK